jgi:predicted alpha/beta-fold hydrolase
MACPMSLDLPPGPDAAMSFAAEHWKFRPHRLLRNAHLQTVAAIYLPQKCAPYAARLHLVPVDDAPPADGGDQIALHEDRPSHWQADAPAVLLIHGLSGCYLSTYMCRMADRLTARGYAVFRMDMRGCGAGEDLARRPTHCGRSGDVAAAIRYISELHPQAPVLTVGYSMGGTLALNMLAEAGETRIGNLEGTLAICPPINLFSVQQQLRTRLGRRYDRFFVKSMWQQITKRWLRFPEMKPEAPPPLPKKLEEINEWVIAPSGGFKDASDYYAQTQPGPKLASIKQPAMIIAAQDDPIVPTTALLEYPVSDSVETHIVSGGGHLGFLAARNGDPDIRWLDWRIIDWIEMGSRAAAPR